MRLGFNYRIGMLAFIINSLTACSIFTEQDESHSAQNTAITYTKLGIEYMRLGQINVALEKLQHALELDSRNIDAHDAIAVLYEKIKEFDKAKNHFENALSLQPENASTLNNFGRFLCDRGEFDEALHYLQQAIAMPLNDNKWFAYTNAGRCELLRGDQEQAENFFRQALQLQANYAPALMELQKISYRKGNYLSARAFLQRYLEVAEQTPGTLWVAIQTELALGNKEAARRFRQELLQKFANSNEAKQIQTTNPSAPLSNGKN